MGHICDGLVHEIKVLDRNLSTFNALEAAGMTNQEIKHSRTLASLLTPSIKGTSVPEKNLKKFISEFLGLDIGNSKDIEVYCEKYHIDILILNKKEKWLCAIENKVYAGQHGDQLKRYKNTIDRKYKDYRKSFLYLTLDEDSASVKAPWVNKTHQQVVDVLKTVKLNKNKHALEFLQEQYIELMEYKILAKINSFNELRKQYKEGVDELYKQAYCKDIRMGYVKHIEKVIPAAKDSCMKLTASNASYIRFYYKSWENIEIVGNHVSLKNKPLPERSVPIMFEVVNDKSNDPDAAVFVKLILSTSKSMDKDSIASAVKEIQTALNLPKTKSFGDYTAIWKSKSSFKASSSKFKSIGYVGVINKWWDDFVKECDAMNIEQVVLDVLKKYEPKA